MTEEVFEIAADLLLDLIQIQSDISASYSNEVSVICKFLPEIYSDSINSILTENKAIIEEFQKKKGALIERNSETSELFNPMKYFNLAETMHSFLIAKLLDEYGEHGQHRLFLNSFLEAIGVEIFEKDHWVVTAEIGRIDILLKRSNPHSVIIIENKSNFAVDQPNQIYRYWYKEIFYPNRHFLNPVDFIRGNRNYQIIYLSPADWKMPTEDTLMKPVGYQDERLPGSICVGREVEIWFFNKEIIEWLERCLDQLPMNNHRMREYIKQYIELWK